LIERGAIAVIDDVEQQIAGLNFLKVLHRHAAVITGALRRERHQIGFEVGVGGGPIRSTNSSHERRQ
jgi:hypothetical protein